MKSRSVVLLILLFSLPVVRAQQGGSKGSITETDKQAVEAWSRATSGHPDPKDVVAGDTQFLLSLTAEQREGARLFKQHCDACHGPEMFRATSFGPALSKEIVEGNEGAVRVWITRGSEHMPAFRYALQPAQIDMIVEFLKKVEKRCQDCRPGDVRRAM